MIVGLVTERSQETRLDAGKILRRVSDEAYLRWLGLPARGEARARHADAMREARRWFAAHARPRRAERTLVVEPIDRERTLLRAPAAPCLTVASRALAARIRRLGSGAVSARARLVVASAGDEVDAAVTADWPSRPDRAWFRERLGTAVVQALLEELREDPRLDTPLGPGQADWDAADLPRLFALLDPRARAGVHVTTGGMLAPRLSALVLCRVHGAEAPAAPRASACRTCSLDPCAFRHES